MTQILARSVLALFATSALAAGPASASVSVRVTPAVAASTDPAPELILAATQHKKTATTHKGAAHKTAGTKGTAHHKATTHKKGKAHHAAAAPAADEETQAGAPGANGHVIEVSAGGATYKVKKGDTLAKVADKLGVEVAELKKLNKIKGTTINIGQVLKAPGSESKVYVAARGDTVAGVAKRFGVTAAALRAENGFGHKTVTLRAGAHVALPEGWRDHGAPAAEPRSPRARTAAPAAEAEAPSYAPGAIGKVVDVPGPMRSYKVRKGDTLEKAAAKLDVSVAELKRINHLKHNRLKAGQVLRAPGGRAKAYVVGPSDTLYSISKRFDVTIEAIRAANGLHGRASIHTGQKLRLPAGYRDRGAAAGVVTPAPRPAYTPPAASETPSTPSETPLARPANPPITNGPPLAPTTAPAPTDAQISEMGRGKFLWPLRGEVISDFGPKSAGQRNDGLNIQAEAGAPVRAAAAGDVVYAGDQVPGFGNLVLIKHADGWVTAYGHLSKVEVKMQQKVSQGQEIGQAGSTGGVAEPQLHFEVRYAPNPLERARPIDPKLVLPR